MPSAPPPVVRAFRVESKRRDEPYSTFIIQSVSGSPHGVDVTLSQAKALSLELSRAILEHEIGEADRCLAARFERIP